MYCTGCFTYTIKFNFYPNCKVGFIPRLMDEKTESLRIKVLCSGSPLPVQSKTKTICIYLSLSIRKEAPGNRKKCLHLFPAFWVLITKDLYYLAPSFQQSKEVGPIICLSVFLPFFLPFSLSFFFSFILRRNIFSHRGVEQILIDSQLVKGRTGI